MTGYAHQKEKLYGTSFFVDTVDSRVGDSAIGKPYPWDRGVIRRAREVTDSSPGQGWASGSTCRPAFLQWIWLIIVPFS
jgi:hypothetical protein